MKKRKIMIGSALLLAVLMIAGGTMAWFTAEAEVVNEFKAGTLKMELKDFFCAPLAQNVNPGDCIAKGVFVQNTGTKRMFVRIKLTPEFVGVEDPNLDIVNFDILNGWKLHTDGYYYYPYKVAAGAPTPMIIEKVCFDGEGMTNKYQGKAFNLTVETDAIQVTHGAAQAVWGVNPLTLGQ